VGSLGETAAAGNYEEASTGRRALYTAAADPLARAGGGDTVQTRAILHRGFRGDWVLTPRHVAGDLEPQVLPDPPPPPSDGGTGWQPPPL
jgi:hypothetical protein